MSKRRRTSSVQGGSDDELDAASETSPITSRKKKKLDPSEQCQLLYDSIRNHKKEDGGAMLCDTFIRVPKRRQEPSYYEIVTNPIDLLRIQQKLKTDSYEDIDELAVDIELLVNNAKAFYRPDSDEYADATVLLEIFMQNKQKLFEAMALGEDPVLEAKRPVRAVGRKARTSVADNDDERSEGSKEDLDPNDMYEELFASVMTAIDPFDNRPLHTEFQLLPSKRHYPDYYDVIEHPIDLKFIAKKIQTSAYTSLAEMEKDLLQMVKNACTFNETGSQIYRDAKALKKSFVHRRAEIETGKYKPTPRPHKRRNTTYSGMVGALKEEAESSDDEMDDMDGEGAAGPMWQLFDQIYNTANAAGAPLGESLWKLPNRRFHPEYYELIKKPISMAQIRNKLKKGLYANITEMTADLYQMIDNAKKAHPNAHKVHRDAVKMQKVLSHKLVDAAQDNADVDSDEDNASVLSDPVTTTPAPKKKGRPRINPLATPGTPSIGRFSGPPNAAVKKRMLSIAKCLLEFEADDGDDRDVIGPFMEKPSIKLYPLYYEVIKHPIDMQTIEANIREDKYGSVDELVGDFRLMFENCRTFNEEFSLIVQDANRLERRLDEKLKEMSALSVGKTPAKMIKGGGGAGRKSSTHLENKFRQMHDAVRDHKDGKTARVLSTLFAKLPSKNDYPDYYDIIKSPMDMERISNKIKQQAYDSLDEVAADFMLMFENACKYNEPDSQIYKDALILQQLVIQKKQELRDGNDDSLPDTQVAVQELLLSLFTSMYNHQDEEGRCFSDSLAELPEYDDVDGNKIRPITLDLIKRRLDKNLYKRLDIFQDDVFACLDRARRLTRTDSQVFEDSIELQAYFIRQRDLLCRNGDVLSSPALSYTALHLSAGVETVRQSKLLQEEEQPPGGEETPPINPSSNTTTTIAPSSSSTTTTAESSMTIDQRVYSPGEFVYYESAERKVPGVLHIERLWTNEENVQMVYGCLFLRPHETYHVTTRRFLERELFKSDQHQAMPLSQVRNKCHVLFIKDYLKFTVAGAAETDVYVCESRYGMRARNFKKIKNWPCEVPAGVQLELRETPIEAKRNVSVFEERVEKHKGELAELQLQEALVERERPNVVVVKGGEGEVKEEGCTYYEQYNTVCSGVVKTGDFVYVATEGGRQAIAQIHEMWETAEGKSSFRGPWLMTPSEVPVIGSRSAYRQEVFLSSVQETNPVIAIVGRCCVLEYAEFTHLRPTEITETDVYICEYLFDETRKQLRKGPGVQDGGLLRRFTHSQQVTPDEIYYYKRTILPQSAAAAAAAMGDDLNSSDLLLGMLEDSMDGGRSSVGSDYASTPSTAHAHAVPSSSSTSTGKKFKFKKQVITGYILYSREHRKTFVAANPEATFGDISRLVGNEWRSLPQVERLSWEERAGKVNEENTRRLEELGCMSPTPFANYELVPNQVFECGWERCDYQFEDPADWCEHSVGETAGHVQAHCNATEAELVCLWRGCIRLKKQAPAFPNLLRLVKHVREVHINKCSAKIIQPADRSKNYMPSKRISAQTPQNTFTGQIGAVAALGGIGGNTNQAHTQLTQLNPSMVPQPLVPATIQIIQAPQPQYVDPMFVTVPPRPQRVLHSEAYLKYIEGYRQDARFITPWEKTLKAREDTVPPVDAAKLPTNWIAYGDKTKPEEVASALWKLRDHMMRDVLTLPLSEY